MTDEASITHGSRPVSSSLLSASKSSRTKPPRSSNQKQDAETKKTKRSRPVARRLQARLVALETAPVKEEVDGEDPNNQLERVSYKSHVYYSVTHSESSWTANITIDYPLCQFVIHISSLLFYYIQNPSPPHSHTPTSFTTLTPSHMYKRPLPFNMKPAQLAFQKDVTYDERGNIIDMVRLDPRKFPSHM